jgi:hypothetical protein
MVSLDTSGTIHGVRRLLPVIEVGLILLNIHQRPHDLELESAIWTLSGVVQRVKNRVVGTIWIFDVPFSPLILGQEGWSALSEKKLPLHLGRGHCVSTTIHLVVVIVVSAGVATATIGWWTTVTNSIGWVLWNSNDIIGVGRDKNFIVVAILTDVTTLLLLHFHGSKRCLSKCISIQDQYTD